jgi:MFS family permease
MRSSLAADEPPGRVYCLINNLNDAIAWGLFPILFSTHHLSRTQIGLLGALDPAFWGIAQLGTGALSDRIGRKWLISTGMLVQAGALALVASSTSYGPWIVAVVLLGLGTAMVYPTLLAASDVAHPIWRAERSVPTGSARCRVRRRRAARGSDRRPVGLHHGGLGRGRAHRRVRTDRRR